MWPPEVVAAAQRIHARYDVYQMKRWNLMAPRHWDNLPTECRREFLDIAEAVIHGDCTYRDQIVPRWVTDTALGEHQ